jgi:hypothetical protein
MSKHPYTAPEKDLSAFNCPHCHAYAKQYWGDATTEYEYHRINIDSISFSRWDHCRKDAVWVESRLIFPTSTQAPPANSDLPDDIKPDYEEAALIFSASPRGSAALLRLCIQKLCKHLGQSGEDINKDIGALVKGGLNPMVQKSLDIVRVIGNEAVHPGTIDLNDKPETALSLFNLVNIITEAMITQPKLIGALMGLIKEMGPKKATEFINL